MPSWPAHCLGRRPRRAGGAAQRIQFGRNPADPAARQSPPDLLHCRDALAGRQRVVLSLRNPEPPLASRPAPRAAGPCRRHALRRPRRGRRRPCRWRGGVQHRADRLPGDPHRPQLLPPDRHADLPAHRQLRRQRRGRRGVQGPCRRAGDQGPAVAGVQLPPHARPVRLPARRGHRGHRRHRHAAADARAAHPWRTKRVHRRLRAGHADRRAPGGRGRVAGRCRPQHERAGPGPGGVGGRRLPVDADRMGPGQRLWRTGGRALACGGLRLRHQAQHPAHAGQPRLPRHRGAGAHPGRRGAGAEAGRHLPVQRPWRPGTLRLRDPGHAAVDRHAASPPSASAWATRSWRWPRAPRPSR